MKAILKLTTAAAALLGSVAFAAAPASAAEWGVSVGVGPGVGFDIHSGGYCDRWGCPSRYWAYPIYYGPVFYDGMWFRGPVYTRIVDGQHWYWIHGGWHRDQWHGARPYWARAYHYGPALGLDYYRAHGFRVNDRDWNDWRAGNGYRSWHTGYTPYRYNNDDRYRHDENWYRTHNGGDNDQSRTREDYQHTGFHGHDYDHDRNGGFEKRGGYDRGAYRNDEQGPPTKTGFEQQRGTGRALTPPITSQRHRDNHSQGDRNPDRQNGNGPTE